MKLGVSYFFFAKATPDIVFLSVLEMWEAKAYGLAMMLALVSGVWPYSKLLVTLFLWFSPPRWVSSKRRGSILQWLEFFGKWSIIDVFVLFMTLASFQVSVNSPYFGFLPQGLYSINLMVVPLWGLYANMLAQLVSQVLSHFIIHYHRKSVSAATKSQEIESQSNPPSNDGCIPEKLGSHSFILDYEASNKRATVRAGVDSMLMGAFFVLGVLIICGCSLPSFSIETFGLVGLAIESGNGGDEAKMYYSAFDLATTMMEQGRYLDTASGLGGLGTLASLLVITVFIVPLAQVVSLLAEWFAPMTAKQRLKNEIVNEILSSWQYMDVYVLSIVITAWQIGDVSEFLLNVYCGSLQETFSSLSYFGILDNEDAQCFRVDATVKAASWILVAAIMVLGVLNHFIRSASRQKKQDENIPDGRRFHADLLRQSKLMPFSPSSTRSSEDHEENVEDANNIVVSPIPPRFTDFYFFATIQKTSGKIDIQDDSEIVTVTIS